MLRGVMEGRVAGAGPRAALDVRAAVAWTAAALALVAAVGGALLAESAAAGPVLAVTTLSSRAAALLEGVGGKLPLGYAFAAGMAAAVNPCGFALLPAYLGLYLGASAEARPGARSIGRALVVGGTVTASFVALFGLAGLVLAAAASAVADRSPWASVLVGVLLVLAGGRMLAGGSVRVGGAGWLDGRVERLVGRPGLLGYAAYGVAFALASLGCALPLFLTVVGTALTAGGFRAAAGQFLLYGLGMGLVVTGATVVVALFGRAAEARARRLGRYLHPASAVLLLVVGAYVVHYWLTAGGLLR